MVCVAIRTLPVGVRVSGRGPAKRFPLGKSPGFGIATLLFFDLGKKQAQAALLHSLIHGDLDLMAGFTGQPCIEGDSREKNSALGVCRIAGDQTPSSPGTRQRIRFQGQGERCEVRMRRTLPSIRNA
jgi:hypothetical protein